MVSYVSRKPPKPKTAGSGKKVVVVFGPPASGVSTVLECLHEASETPNKIVPYVGPESIQHAEEALEHVDVVFLDVDGGVFSPNDVQALVDNRLVYAGQGAVVRMYAPTEMILERAQSRPDYVNAEDLSSWSRDILPVEERIRTHALNYFMVPNHDLEQAIVQLALRSGINR